ncbi:flagellar biosynthesis protein FlhA [Woodsholea maritima]|uniref:flagellar biosynthesis protein FlhA n=1 Tax=Woodsholea maritima TaxID=240237 RepID=UPI0003AA7C63|nr:flagellar biosynthesis protein FlhA [Woodsholea maritima]
MIKKYLLNNKDLVLVSAIVLVILTLFAPIPSIILDLGILMNFGLALTILLLSLYVSRPVEFSTFPSLLLIATLFRLSLNVAATRLILTGGEAGQVIQSIGSFAVGGFFIVGLVVFFILVVVQYVVVTAGAQRVSEVAARFMLDSLPGQQMSIDADLNMGTIAHEEAKAKRQQLDKEASFYGAMDGASKFVKGDSIAGIIIVFIDIIAGWIIGMAQMGMAWDEALQRFSLLTIGDGISTQLPALIISIATGILVTRSAHDNNLSNNVFEQLSSVRRIPLMVSIILTALVTLPGMPKWPMLFFIPLTIFLAWRMYQYSKQEKLNEGESEGAISEDSPQTLPLSVAMGIELSERWQGERNELINYVASFREAQKAKLGLVYPAIKFIKDEKLARAEYEIRIYGTRYANAIIEPDMIMAIESASTKQKIDGISAREPAFGLKAVWVEPEQAEDAKSKGYSLVDPLSIFKTHLSHILQREASALITRNYTIEYLDYVRARQAGLVEELIPNILSMSDVQRILQNLVSENVPIKNIDLVVETLVDVARTEKDIPTLTEIVRQNMGHVICDYFRGNHNDLAVLSLEPRLEHQIKQSIQANGGGERFALEPMLADKLTQQLLKSTHDMMEAGRAPVMLCSSDVRRALQYLCKRAIPKLSLISVAELTSNIELASFHVISLPQEERPNPLNHNSTMSFTPSKV